MHNSKKMLSGDKNKIDIKNNEFNEPMTNKLVEIAKGRETTDKGNNLDNNQQEPQIDFSYENRLVQIIALQSKGLTQQEIARELGVNQSTISRDLQYLKQGAKRQIWKYMEEDIWMEYLRYWTANNEISKKLWEIVQDEKTSPKDKTNALSLLNESSTKRLEIFMNGPESLKNVKKNISEINESDSPKNDSIIDILLNYKR